MNRTGRSSLPECLPDVSILPFPISHTLISEVVHAIIDAVIPKRQFNGAGYYGVQGRIHVLIQIFLTFARTIKLFFVGSEYTKIEKLFLKKICGESKTKSSENIDRKSLF